MSLYPRPYPSDLSGAEWEILAPLIPPAEYERLCETSEAMIYATMGRIMLRRLARA